MIRDSLRHYGTRVLVASLSTLAIGPDALARNDGP